MVIVVIGVTGSGKTKVGSLLADHLRWQFYDAEDFYSPASREKLTGGIPLTDTDRAAWLLTLRNLLIQNVHSNRSVVLACAALKDTFRQSLRVNTAVYFVYLKGTRAEIEARMSQQPDSSMNADLLTLQFDELEEPKEALVVKANQAPEAIIDHIRKELNV